MGDESIGLRAVTESSPAFPSAYTERVMIVRNVVAYFVAFCASQALLAQRPIQIEIKSSWSGLGSAPEMQMAITGNAGNFTSIGRKINPAAVKELLDAIGSPSIEHPSLTECGADPEWLEANYASALEESTHRKLRDLSKEQIELFHAQFVGQQSVDADFQSLFQSWHTDDFPRFSVMVHEGTQEFGVTSDSQYPFMLPWFGTDRARGGYSCRVSRAILALLPKGFTNRERLDLGHGFRWDLTEKIMDRIRPEWDSLNAQHLVGPEIAPILARYDPLKSAVSNLISIDLDGKESWNAELGTKDLPPNLVIGVSLPYRKNRLDGADQFLNHAPSYTALVLSVPWLRQFLLDRPQSRIEVRYVNGQSLSTKATHDLAEDLRSHGKPDLAQVVERDSANSAFIEVDDGTCCWSRAVVLPNRDLLLWHFKGDSVLGFSANQFKTWDFYGLRSTGTLIELDGAIRN
jgi:hypothetical protein